MIRTRTLVIAAAGALTLTAAACGDTAGPSDSSADARRVEIDMADNSFSPASVDATEGETVRFVFTNTGAVDHDAFIGDADAQEEHGMEMEEMGEMDHEDDGDAVTVEPGDTAELTYTFDDSGSLLIGCHQPGHFEQGMKIAIDVT